MQRYVSPRAYGNRIDTYAVQNRRPRRNQIGTAIVAGTTTAAVSGAASAASGMTPYLLLALLGGGAYAIYRMFGREAVVARAKDVTKTVVEATGAVVGELLLKPTQVLGLLADMAKEAMEREEEEQQLLTQVIPGRCEEVFKIETFVKENSFIKMGALKFLVFFARDYEEHYAKGWMHYYTSRANAQGYQAPPVAKGLITSAKNGTIGVMYDTDLVCKKILEKTYDKARKQKVGNFEITKADYQYCMGQMEMAKSRRANKYSMLDWIMSDAMIVALEKLEKDSNEGVVIFT